MLLVLDAKDDEMFWLVLRNLYYSDMSHSPGMSNYFFSVIFVGLVGW